MKGKCAKQTVTATIITTEGRRIIGSNWCRFPQKECPRKDMKTGEGYWMCKDICGQDNHAEVDACLQADELAKGATLYIEGHTYCCENCKKVMNAYGISEIIFIKDKNI